MKLDGSAYLVRLAGAAAILIVWGTAAYLVNSQVFPGPGPVIKRLGQIVLDGSFAHQFFITLCRVCVAFTVAVVISVSLGIPMGRSAFVGNFFRPALLLWLMTPAIAWATLCVMWFGLSEASAAAAVSIVVTPYLLAAVIDATALIDQSSFDVVRVFRANRWTVLLDVILAQIAPTLLSTGRFAFAFSWKVATIVELFGFTSGIGYELALAFGTYSFIDLFAWAVGIGVGLLIVDVIVFGPLNRFAKRSGLSIR